MMRLLLSAVACLISVGSGNACALGERVDLQTRMNAGAAIVSVSVLGDTQGPSDGNWYIVPVRVDRVLRGEPLPNDQATEATLIFRHQTQRDLPFETQGRYLVGLWAPYDMSVEPDERPSYQGTLGVYGGGGFCIGQMIYEPNSPMGRALTVAFDGEGDQDAELEILDTYLMGLQ
ncbi:hypothetical protein V8J82_11450 [Gymnodinialimonas sp. 2305UL16-5]|uniref:hypothetical protein n=1 Tax=Gymnodinialimonas mytili TaxID=3126503 RepID=UPI00309ED04D